MSFREPRPKYTRSLGRTIYADTIHVYSAQDAAAYVALCDEKLAEFPSARDLNPEIGRLEADARCEAATWDGSYVAIDKWRRAVGYGCALAKSEESARRRAEAEARRAS